MSQLLVRNLDPEDLNALKQLALEHHRSLESEVRRILKEAASRTREMRDFRGRVEALRASLGDKTFSDSAELIREDRETR